MTKGLAEQLMPLYEKLGKDLKEYDKALDGAGFSHKTVLKDGHERPDLKEGINIIAMPAEAVRKAYEDMHALLNTCRQIDYLKGQKSSEGYSKLNELLSKELKELGFDISSMGKFGIHKDTIRLVKKAKEIGKKAKISIKGGLEEKVWHSAGPLGDINSKLTYIFVALCLGIFLFSEPSYTGFTVANASGQGKAVVFVFIAFIAAISIFAFVKKKQR